MFSLIYSDPKYTNNLNVIVQNRKNPSGISQNELQETTDAFHHNNYSVSLLFEEMDKHIGVCD